MNEQREPEYLWIDLWSGKVYTTGDLVPAYPMYEGSTIKLSELLQRRLGIRRIQDHDDSALAASEVPDWLADD